VQKCLENCPSPPGGKFFVGVKCPGSYIGGLYPIPLGVTWTSFAKTTAVINK